MFYAVTWLMFQLRGSSPAGVASARGPRETAIRPSVAADWRGGGQVWQLFGPAPARPGTAQLSEALHGRLAVRLLFQPAHRGPAAPETLSRSCRSTGRTGPTGRLLVVPPRPLVRASGLERRAAPQKPTTGAIVLPFFSSETDHRLLFSSMYLVAKKQLILSYLPLKWTTRMWTDTPSYLYILLIFIHRLVSHWMHWRFALKTELYVQIWSGLTSERLPSWVDLNLWMFFRFLFDLTTTNSLCIFQDFT